MCVETIYAYIRADKENGGKLWKYCRHQLKHRKRQVSPHLHPHTHRHALRTPGRRPYPLSLGTRSAPYTAVQNRTMIDERPADWDGSTPGDFEMDTIVGKDGNGAIVTLVERNTNFMFARKLPKGKNAMALAEMVVTMLLPYIGKIRSITTDNGSEFAEHIHIAKRLITKIFFTLPYSSWEKECIEYHNKLIRQYIPKGTDFDTVSDQMLKDVIIKINKRPRLKLGFSSPVVVFFNLFIL